MRSVEILGKYVYYYSPLPSRKSNPRTPEYGTGVVTTQLKQSLSDVDLQILVLFNELFRLQMFHSVRRDEDIIMNGECVRFWKEAVKVYLKMLSTFCYKD
jgi:hypothetical protein